ncbi:MAG: hypothetical protein P2A85_15420 [Microcoleus anatoxicus]|uniref:hypothetical protein n=1 Tax=Microcoleus anatoxicus TaxID=2705319 RepID=UPI00366D37B4
MVDFCIAFMCILVLVGPTIALMRLLAFFISENMSDWLFLPWLFIKPSEGYMKSKFGYATPQELRHAVRVTIIICGIITASFLPRLLVPVIVWVLAISFLVSFVDSN